MSDSSIYDRIDRIEYERSVDALRTQFDAPAFEAAWAAGLALTIDQAIEFALKEEP